ncbi:hypothetical protein L8F19_03010 [Mycoplasmopsis bovis]|nr:hypothetical protein L8F19_03010 [Mycoplasmopsis bovis]
MFKPQNLLRTTITANLFKVKTEKFNLKGIAKVVAREKAKNAVYSIVENTVLQKKDKKKEKQELQKQQEQIKQTMQKLLSLQKKTTLPTYHTKNKGTSTERVVEKKQIEKTLSIDKTKKIKT